jgi:hypothetical protein
MSDEISLKSLYEDMKEFFVGKDGALTEFSDDIKAKIENAKGYISAKMEGDQPNKLTPLGVEHTPLYWALEANFEPNKALNQRAVRATGTLNSIETILGDMKKQGTVYLPKGSYINALFPGGTGSETITIDDGLAQIQMLKDSYAKETESGQYSGLKDTAELAIRGMESVSPLLIASAGYKPEATRKLMGAHLLLDALTGRLNFRTPELAGKTSLIQLLNPYLAMATIGLTSVSTKEF